MLLLFINTATPDESVTLVKNGKFLAKKKWIGCRDETEKVLKNLVALLKKKKLSFKNIDGIVVAKGPGGFSSVRAGVTIANTMAFALKIPLYGTLAEKFDIMEIAEAIREKTLPPEKVVSPFYSKQPNITLKS